MDGSLYEVQWMSMTAQVVMLSQPRQTNVAVGSVLHADCSVQTVDAPFQVLILAR